jgi:hypothetical protein
MRMATIGLVLLVAALLAAPVSAQQAPSGVQIETTPQPKGERPAAVVPSPLHYETTRAPDTGKYSTDVRVEHDPAFIEPFTATFEDAASSGQYGLAGWTSPNMPVGPSVIAYREVPGWVGFGFSIVWGGPPRPGRPLPAKAPAAPTR